MLAEHAAGWLLEQMVALDTDAEKWWKQGYIGFIEPDVDYDPAFDSAEGPPPGWELLPVYQPEKILVEESLGDELLERGFATEVTEE